MKMKNKSHRHDINSPSSRHIVNSKFLRPGFVDSETVI